MSALVPFESQDGTLVTAEHLECYENYCELMELMEQRDEELEKIIAKAKEDTLALILWRDNLVESSEKRIERTYEIIESSKTWQQDSLKEMKERTELEEKHHQGTIQRGEDREEELKKTILAGQVLMKEKEKLLNAEIFRSQQLKQGIL